MTVQALKIHPDGSGGAKLRLEGAGSLAAGSDRFSVRIERNHPRDRWLHQSGWHSSQPEEALTLSVAADGGDLILDLDTAICDLMEEYDVIEVTLIDYQMAGRGPWMFDEEYVPVAPARAQAPAPPPPPPPPPPPRPASPPKAPPPPPPPPPLPPEEPYEGTIEEGGTDARKWVKQAPFLLLALLFAIGIAVAVWWFLQSDDEGTGPYVRDGAAVLREARSKAASGDCGLALTLALEAGQTMSHGPALIALGEAYDPVADGSRCLGGDQGADAAIALSFYGDACEVGEKTGGDKIRAMGHWVESSRSNAGLDDATAQRLLADVERALNQCTN